MSRFRPAHARAFFYNFVDRTHQTHDFDAAVGRDDDGPVRGRPFDVDRLRNEVFARPQLVDDLALFRVPDGHRVVVEDQKLHVAAPRSKTDLLDLVEKKLKTDKCS